LPSNIFHYLRWYWTVLGILTGKPGSQRLPAFLGLERLGYIAGDSTRTDPRSDPLEKR
jgi:hypothetical protein